MEATRIDFSAVPWEEPAPGMRHRCVTRGTKKLRLVEITAEFVEADWCRKGHTGMVLEGELELSLPGKIVRYAAGDGFFVLGGEDERHRAKAVTPRVRLLLVDET
jgi:hypothetical protein